MGGETGDLVAHAFGGGDGDFVNDALVRVKIEREARVVLLDDGASALFDGLCADSLEVPKTLLIGMNMNATQG